MNTNDRSLSCAARAVRAAVLALAAATVLPACAPVLVGGAVLGGALASVDRRTAGTQVEDQAIELKGATRVRELTGEQANVSVTSYNRIVLLTGEVPDAAARSAVEQAIGRIEGVGSVVNELAVMGKSSLTARSNDAVLSARVKAGFIDAKDLQANTIKVTTERGVVHLMGRVTEREAARAVAVARSVPGVQKVVRVFEILTEEQLAGLLKSSGQQAPKQ
ncbi:MAG: BON domain-containing protein [Rubrivivax sp.]|jgi:osmotically-inducible protein OsmY